MNTFLEESDIWALSITATGKCNCDCSYCHFYALRDRKKYNFDMPERLFKNYVRLIKVIKEKYHKNLHVRFSGGEPLVMGDRLFEYCKYLYDETGISPYILSNGRLLDEEIIKKSKKAHIDAYLVSVENPFDQSEGAPRTEEVLQKIRTLNCEDVNVLPAIMVVKNNAFHQLLEICDYVYDRIQMLPSFSELTYHAYEIATSEQINDLYLNVKAIAKKYYGKAAIKFFPYISPELYANNQKNYMTELDLENSIGVADDNAELVAENLYKKLALSYQKNPCEDVNCDWYEDCRIIKWLWLYTYDNPDMTVGDKLKSFCALRKALNSGLLEGILEGEPDEKLA